MIDCVQHDKKGPSGPFCFLASNLVRPLMSFLAHAHSIAHRLDFTTMKTLIVALALPISLVLSACAPDTPAEKAEKSATEAAAAAREALDKAGEAAKKLGEAGAAAAQAVVEAAAEKAKEGAEVAEDTE